MEQKKLLWIAVTVGTFLLVITGTVLLINVPGKKNGDYQKAQMNTGNVWTFDGTGYEKPAEGTGPVKTDIVEKGEVKEEGVVSGGVAVSPENSGVLPGENPDGVENTALEDAALIEKDGTRKKTLEVDTIKAEKISANVIDVREITGSPATPKAPVEKPGVKEVSKKAVPQKPAATDAEKKTVPPAKTQSISYWIQLASLSDKLKAEKAREDLNEKMISPEIFTKEIDGKTYYRLRIGPYKTKQEAEYWLAKVKEMKGFEKSYISETKK